MVQVGLQPSPELKLPSSHSSVEILTPSPQTAKKYYKLERNHKELLL
jgi:hypothetical protein